MSKIDDYDAVKYAVHELATYKHKLNEADIFARIDYEIYKIFASRIQYSGYSYTQLRNILDSLPIMYSDGYDININVKDVFNIDISNYCEIQIHFKNEIYNQIKRLQILHKLSKYTKIDEDVIFTSSVFFFMPMYKKCIELVCKQEIYPDDILNFIEYIYNALLKYVPIMQNLEVWAEQNPITNSTSHSSGDILDIDYSKYSIACDHTALKTGEWNE